MNERMPDHITDGPDFEDADPVPDVDEDEAYERLRQHQIDDLNDTIADIGGGLDRRAAEALTADALHATAIEHKQ